MRKIDLLTDHGIIVLDETERSLLLDMLSESIDMRVANESDEIMESLGIYNKLGIGKVADSTIEHEFGIHHQKKAEKQHEKPKKKSKRKPKRPAK